MSAHAAIYLSGLLLALCTLLSGCSKGSEPKLVGEAQVALDKGDLKTSAVLVRSAIQIMPNSARARFLFGKVLLHIGDINVAEVELRKALELKYPEDDIVPLLASISLARQNYALIIRDYAGRTLTNKERQADLTAVVASAYELSGQHDTSVILVASGLKVAPDNIPLQLAQARFATDKGGADEALKIVDAVIKKAPLSADAWRLRGDLLGLARQPSAESLAAYRKALEIQPDNIYAMSRIISIQLVENDIAGANQEFSILSQLHPLHPQTRFVEASIALASGKPVIARELLAQLMSQVRDNPLVLQLAGATELQLNSLMQAEVYLVKFISLAPSSLQARQMLASVRLRRGDANGALQILRPLLDEGTTDAEVLTLAAQAHLATGNNREAEAFFTRILRRQPDDVKTQTALALTHLANGEKIAFDELQSIASNDKGTLGDLALISARLKYGDLNGALTAIDGLEKKTPTKALPFELRGRVYLLRHDSANARRNFEKALAQDPIYFPSVAALAQIDVAERKTAAAQSRFEALLKIDPTNVGALVALAGLRARLDGNANETAQLLNRAVEASPNDPAIRLLQVEHWLYRGLIKQAVESAQVALAANPNDVLMTDALGRAQMANNQLSQALVTFGKLASLQPGSATAQMRLANIYLQTKNPDAAERALRRAIEIEPELLEAQQGLIALAVQSEQPKKALQYARKVQRLHPKEAIGYVLEGDIHSAIKDLASAATAYQAGLPLIGGGTAALRMYGLLKTAKTKADADHFADEWLKQTPKDVRLRFYLAEAAVRANEFSLAERYYTAIVALEPRNAKATNDLAWILAKTNKPGAVELAERALALSPDNPIGLDTLAFALAAENKLARAIEVSRSAVRLAPDVPLARLNLAKIYLQAQDKKSAKEELDGLAKISKQYPERQEVVDLLKTL